MAELEAKDAHMEAKDAHMEKKDEVDQPTKAAESKDFWQQQVSRSIKIAFAAEQIMRECGLLQELWELEDYTKSLPKPGEPKDRKECVL